MLLCHGKTRIADLVCSAAMPLEQTTLSTLAVALAVALVLLAIWVAWLQRSHALLRRRLTRLVGDNEGAGLDEVLDRQFRRLDSVAERVEALNKLHHELEALSQRSIQRVGVIRFNPFADTGGDQSFAMALLDAEGNGVVVSRAGRHPQGARAFWGVTTATSFTDERALAIVNPVAGNGAGERVARRIAADFRKYGIRLDVVRTPARDEAARLAREGAADGYRVIVAAGGDGTANEVANGIVGSAAALALYPIGSGNDFARALGYPKRARDVPRFIREARRRTIDVGDLNGRVFVNAAGVGIDGHVAERVSATSRVVGQTLGYFVGALVGITTYRPRPMRVLVDGELRSGSFLAVVAANGTHFGSGMHVAPEASLAKLYRGTHVNGGTIVMMRARVVEIELERPLPAELDGEVTRLARLSIHVRPQALDVLAR
ncbi:MAG: YegS/Rv2252/BmrU family lipid kinase [Chloroflexi bacterium]|nr:MAG: YegS/Rv2252/BmrU family lipid kinase [Chloroflexota bacterium]